MTTVLIADDHALLRGALRSLLNAEPDLHVAGEASDGWEALELTAELRPEVVITDFYMPGPSGIEIARRIRERFPDTAVLIITLYEDKDLVCNALDSGAAGCLPKAGLADELVPAVRSISKGNAHFENRLGDSCYEQSARTQLDLSMLSDEDLAFLHLLVHGYLNREIAEELHVDMHEVMRLRDELRDKFGLRSRADVLRFARENGLVEP